MQSHSPAAAGNKVSFLLSFPKLIHGQAYFCPLDNYGLLSNSNNTSVTFCFYNYGIASFRG
jgi:hypothetical protein